MQRVLTLLLMIGVTASLAMAQAVPDASFRSTEGYSKELAPLEKASDTADLSERQGR